MVGMTIKRIKIFLNLHFCILLSIFCGGCALFIVPEEVKKAEAFCNVFLEKSRGEWDNAGIDSIAKTNPMAGRNKKEALKNAYDAMLFCQRQVYWGQYEDGERASLEKIRSKINSYYSTQEESLFLKSTGGKKLCATHDGITTSLNSLLYHDGKKPSKSCLYQTNQSLLAQQVTDSGVLAASWFTDVGKVLYIYKDNVIEQGLVDGDVIEAGFFEYTGQFSYQSLFGDRTVNSFRRIDATILKEFLFYGVRKKETDGLDPRIMEQAKF